MNSEDDEGPPLFEEALQKLDTALSEIQAKADTLLQPKWTPLDLAREYVTGWLLGSGPSTEQEALDIQRWEARAIHGVLDSSPKSEYGLRYTIADEESRRFLIQVLASGELEARGIVHAADVSDLILCEPLSKVWWHRIIGAYNPALSAGDEFPVHTLSWTDGVIRRRLAEKPLPPDEVLRRMVSSLNGPLRGLNAPGPTAVEGGARIDDATSPDTETTVLATVTGIEINRMKLLELVKPPEGSDPIEAASPRRRKREPNHGQVETIRQAATKVVAKERDDHAAAKVAEMWGTQDARVFIEKHFKMTPFLAATAKERGRGFNHNSDARGYRRALFGEK